MRPSDLFTNKNESLLCMKCGSVVNKLTIVNFPSTFGKYQSINFPECVNVRCPHCKESNISYIPSDLFPIIRILVLKGYSILSTVITNIEPSDQYIDTKGIVIYFDNSVIPFEFSNSTSSLKDFNTIYDEALNIFTIVSNLKPVVPEEKIKITSEDRFHNLIIELKDWCLNLPNIKETGAPTKEIIKTILEGKW